MKNSKMILASVMMIALFSITMIGGCKKETATTNTTCTDGIKNGTETGIDCGGSCNACTTAVAKVKTVTLQTSVLYTDSLIYDSQGRQIVYDGGANNYGTYTYNGSTVTKTVQSSCSGNPCTYYLIYTLNANNLATYRIYRDGAYTSFTQSTFDAEGHLLTEISIDSSTGLSRDTIINTWTNGNLTTSYSGSVNPFGHYSYTYVYTYLTDKLNTADYGTSFLGKTSTNLVHTISYNGTVYTLDYEYDTQGRVKKSTSTPSISNYYAEFTYY